MEKDEKKRKKKRKSFLNISEQWEENVPFPVL